MYVSVRLSSQFLGMFAKKCKYMYQRRDTFPSLFEMQFLGILNSIRCSYFSKLSEFNSPEASSITKLSLI